MKWFPAERSDDVTAFAQRVMDSFLGRSVLRFVRMEGFDRSIVISAQAFTALIPLFIIVASAAPAGQEDAISQSIIRRFALTGESAAAVDQLFSTPPGATSSVTLFSAFLLLYSGVAFTRRMQRMYRAAWGQEKVGVRSTVFATLGLLALVAEVVVAYAIRAIFAKLPARVALGHPDLAGHRRGALDVDPLPPPGSAGALAPVAGRRRRVGRDDDGLRHRDADLHATDHDERTDKLRPVRHHDHPHRLPAGRILRHCLLRGHRRRVRRIGRRWLMALKVRFRLMDPGRELPVAAPAAAGRGLTSDDLLALIRVLKNWLIMTAAVWIATALVPGIDVHGGFGTYLAISLIFGLVNAVLGPVLEWLAGSLTWLTLGVSALLVNGLLFATTAGLTPQMDIAGLGSAVLGAVVVAMAGTLLELVFRPVQPDTNNEA